ncbi:class II aldolase/adducin family protein [Rhodobacteraceae bacterium M382]|nr:class II aldolase/adducin family protein [Rhodobacteraceae bacterium M382]
MMQFWDERVELAAVLRLAARGGWQRGVDNHFSLAVGDGLFLVNARGLHWSEVTASNLLLLDHDGSVIEGDGTVEASAFYIHSHIHRTVPSATCVLHAHPTYATALGCVTGGRLENCHQDALRFYGRVAYDDGFNGSAFGDDEGRRIANTIGNGSIVVMAHHGITVVGPSVAKAYDDFYNFEVACEYQITAMSTGQPLAIMPEAQAAKLAPTMFDDEQTNMHFAAMLRMLDREEPEYAH